MSSSSSNSASTSTPVNSTSPSIGSVGDVIQILENEYKAILTDLNAKKFPKIKESVDKSLIKLKELNVQNDILAPNNQDDVISPIFAMLSSEKNFLSTEKARKTFFSILKPLVFNRLITNASFTRILRSILSSNNNYLSLGTGTTSFFIVQLIQILTFSLSTLPKNELPTDNDDDEEEEEIEDENIADEELVDIDINGEATNSANIEKKEMENKEKKEAPSNVSEEEDIIFAIFSIFFVIYYNFVFSGNTRILNSANEAIVRNTITTTFPMLINMLMETISKSNDTSNANKELPKTQHKPHKDEGETENNSNEKHDDDDDDNGDEESSSDEDETNEQGYQGYQTKHNNNNNNNSDDDDDDDSDMDSDDDDDDDNDDDDDEFGKRRKKSKKKLDKKDSKKPQQKDNAKSDGAEKADSIQTKSPCFDGVFHLFDDICTMTLGEKPQYLKGLPVPFQPAIGLDVIELVINTHSEVFHDYEEFRTLISSKICPAVVRLFDNCESFRVFVRLGRLVNTLASKFMSEAPKVIESLLTKFSSFLYQSNANNNGNSGSGNTQTNSKVLNWQQTVVLEVFRTLFSSPDIVCKMYYYYDMKDSDKSPLMPKRSVSRLIRYTSVRSNIALDGDEDEDEDDKKAISSSTNSGKVDTANGDTNDRANSEGGNNAGEEEEEEDSDNEEEMTDIKLGNDDEEEEAVGASTTTNNDKVDGADAGTSPSTGNSAADARNEQALSPQVTQTPQDIEQERGGEEKSRVLTRIAETIGALLGALPFKSPFAMEGPSTQNPALQSVIDLGPDTEQPPAINPRYKATVALQCILNLSHSLWSLAGHVPADIRTHKNIGALITESTYEANFKGLYATLEHTSEESTIQFILKGYYNNIYALSVYGLDNGISLYVNSLCKFATHYVSGGDSTGIRSVIPPLKKSSVTVPLRTVEAMKTLMSVVHCMGSSLAACWRPVLLTVESIDKIMAQEAAQKNTAVEDEPNDFGIAAVALSTLFESTIQTETGSFLVMFEELVKLALERLGTSEAFADVPGTGRTTCFFFNKVIETAQFNTARIDRMWDAYCSFFRAAIRHASSAIYNSGLLSFKELLILAIRGTAEQKSMIEEEEKKGNANKLRDPHSSTIEDLMGMQTRFFELVEEVIFSEDVTLGVKTSLLDALRDALGVIGDDLTFGWDKLLESIYNSVKIGDKEIAPAVFTIVQLIGSKFLPRLPEAKSADLVERDALYNYIKVVSSYVLQQDNETIIDLIWEIATYLSTIEEENQQQRRILLWELLLNEVKNHCNDERDQVRNSSIINLLKILRNYSGCFIEHTWYLCIWDVLFPAINFIKLHVTSISVVTERGPPKTPLKGERSTTDLALQRKSEDEVRNENWCLSMRIILKEICGLFQSSTSKRHMSALPRFSEAWRQLCEYLRSCAVDIPAQDVGECTIESTIVLLTVAATDLGFERDFWALTLETLAAIVATVAARSPNKRTSQIFAGMVRTLGEVVGANPGSVQPADVVRVLDIVAPLPMLPIDDELGPETGMSGLHAEVLAFCSAVYKLPPAVCSDAVTEGVIVLLAQYPQQAFVARYQRQGEAPSEREQRRWAGVLAFSAAAIELAATTFCGDATAPTVRESALSGFVGAVEDALMARHREAPPAIQRGICAVWARLFTSLRAVVDSGTAAISAGGKEKCWADLIEVCADLVFFDKGTQGPVVAGTAAAGVDVKERCAMSAELINAVTAALIAHGERYPGVGPKLVETLFAGAKVAAALSQEVCRACYHGAFVLAMNGVSREDLIGETSALVVEQAKDLIERFNGSEGKEREDLHMEVVCVLSELKDFRTTLREPPKAAGDNPRGFLLKLFGVLCESTSAKERDVKVAVKELLDIIGNEFLGF